MRAPLKALLKALPLSTLITALLVFWQGIPKGKARVVILVAICVALGAQTLKTWLTHPQGRPLVLLRYGLMREASRLPLDGVVKKAGESTYVYVEPTPYPDVLILWCFDGAALDAMESRRSLRRVAIPARAFRLNLTTNGVDQYTSFVLLEANGSGEERTYSIMSPTPQEVDWQAVEREEGAASVAAYRRALAWANAAISGRTRTRGRGDRFHK